MEVVLVQEDEYPQAAQDGEDDDVHEVRRGSLTGPIDATRSQRSTGTARITANPNSTMSMRSASPGDEHVGSSPEDRQQRLGYRYTEQGEDLDEGSNRRPCRSRFSR